MSDDIFYFIMFLLACVGIYHIIEEVIWWIHTIKNPEEVQNMLDYMQQKEKR